MRSSEAVAPAKLRFAEGNRNDFYRTLRARVNAYLAAGGRSRYADATIALKGLAFLAVAAAAYGLILSGRFGHSAMLALACLYALAALMLAIGIGHDAAHQVLFRSPRLNFLVQFCCFALLGADPYLWRLRHVKSHHTFPNVNGCDIDIDSNLFLRLSPNHPLRPHQRLQHLYAPLIFWLVDLHTVFVQDPHYLLKRRLANMIDVRHPPFAYASFVLCKAIYVAVVLGLPLALLPLAWWHVIVGMLVASFVASCAFVYLLIGTHFAEETAFPEVGADGTVPLDWARHAMATALDWSPYSRLAHFIAGGANCHAAHHLFPNVSHAHYIAITRIIARTAAEFGVPHNVTTLPRMVRSHFRFLRRMARPAARIGGTAARLS